MRWNLIRLPFFPQEIDSYYGGSGVCLEFLKEEQLAHRAAASATQTLTLSQTKEIANLLFLLSS